MSELKAKGHELQVAQQIWDTQRDRWTWICGDGVLIKCHSKTSKEIERGIEIIWSVFPSNADVAGASLQNDGFEVTMLNL